MWLPSDPRTRTPLFEGLTVGLRFEELSGLDLARCDQVACRAPLCADAPGRGRDRGGWLGPFVEGNFDPSAFARRRPTAGPALTTSALSTKAVPCSATSFRSPRGWSYARPCRKDCYPDRNPGWGAKAKALSPTSLKRGPERRLSFGGRGSKQRAGGFSLIAGRGGEATLCRGGKTPF